MATEAPDPRTFETWEDAFQYPIPVVRRLEQQLRNNAHDNREKLRSLVGASYRSLLHTAETIIDMEVRMGQVETKLAVVGQSCNSRGLERIANNAGKMDIHTRSRDAERYTFASQLSVLRNAPLVATRLMKREGSYLLIAKVLVISRLLHKSLSQSANNPPIVGQLWEKLLSVRRKLLRRIDKRLSNTNGEVASLVESMCAYALATSSTPTDVLHHFHKMRLDKMNSELRAGSDELAKHGINALKLCIQTCLDTQTIFPRRLAESLAKLKAHPLIRDPEIRGLYELNLDVHDRWLSDEARNYTPWPRHDELQRPEAERILHRWSKDAVTNFLKGVKAALEGEERLQEVANLRQELIETWILSGSRMAGVKSANVLDDLRETMSEKLENIVRSRTSGLQTVVSDLTTRLDAVAASKEASALSLWSTIDKASDLSNGAQTFKSTILNTHQGRDESVISVISAFDNWMESVLEVKGIVKSMKEARWDDTFAEDVDDDSDDDLGDSKQTLLSDDDPKLLEEATQEALGEAMQNLGRSFSAMTKPSDGGDADGSIQKATFILRVVREIGDRLPRLRLQERATSLPSPFTADILQPLYMTLASHTAQPNLDKYKISLHSSLNVKTKSYILWEGHPPLPSQPSPSAFRFLRELDKSMRALGSDLWAPSCVSVLKSCVAEELNGLVGEQDDASAATKDEDKAKPTESSSELKNQRLKQLFFDLLYIQRFVDPNGGEDKVSTLRLKVDVTDLDDAAMSRLKKNAADYAKKTYLLFALLA
ncbi:Vps51 domain containing protein [Pyrenophora tritici-repentis]|nr:Vps51 domain containing protein [Pyrenophora tritici-repentis]KAI1531673.1 Vps51 domain containing protein [Pyrenophora tritici-repentis]KAI1534201.1 Vps51 domain containing protein [Pyrenophora tritici-repentis]KAI1544864.1 Vps51 domain containing protein [Pyrenophora tritici-repentis]KAI1585220.1 Vps51 domain containing protein [Pyrenophora tritici-repentis]